jgi:hypothetical protein
MSRSCYILELSVSPGHGRRGELFVYGRPVHLRRCLESEFLDEDPRDRVRAVAMVAYGETVALWVVEEGRVVRGIDLRPFVRVRLPDGLDLTLAEARLRDEPWKAMLTALPSVDVTLDWDGIASVTPPLRGEPLRPGESVDLETTEEVLAAFDTYLEVLDDVAYGYEDVDGGAPPPPGFVDPDAPR